MIIRNRKWVLFNFLPYEYKALEKYLGKMALKGWKLHCIRGMVLEFKRIEPKMIKYSVDIMDKVSFLDGKNSDRALEYREYCKTAGWDFVCEKDKIQIYCSEGKMDIIPIHTEEREKFKCIFKASFKYIILNLITLTMLLLTQYMTTVGSNNANFLASNLQLVTLFSTSMFTIHECIGLVNFITWVLKGKGSLKKNEEVSYNYFKGIKFKRAIYKLMLVVSLLVILSMAMNGEILALRIISFSLLIVALISTLMNFVSKSKYKKKKKINSIIYVVIIMISFIAMNRLIFNDIFSIGRGNNNKMKSNNYILSLKDFNDEPIDEDSLYINEESGILATKLFYMNSGKNTELGYELFESKYEWVVKYNFNKIMNWMEKINVKYIEKETDLPSDIKVYNNEKGHIYFMVSSNKIIEIYSWDNNLSESELLNKVYEKVFK